MMGWEEREREGGGERELSPDMACSVSFSLSLSMLQSPNFSEDISFTGQQRYLSHLR